jgi:predicted house-cleaning noncanonical NTP pyrophosphatase (MazG superfamily)
MATFNKLVRDRIPEIIQAKGETAVTRVLDEAEYREALRQKLGEEVQELLDSDDPEELADIMEVVRALAVVYGEDAASVERRRVVKAEQRGAFEQRIFLVETKGKEN